MKVNKTDIPTGSLLYNNLRSYDYYDSYVRSVDRGTKDLITICRKLFATTPGWISWLMGLRDRLVKVFGLKTSRKEEKGSFNNLDPQPGDQIGIFHIIEVTQREIVMGEDDKHLNFRVSIFLGEPSDEKFEKSLTFITVVQFNNFWGRAYFFFVKPFHRIIVRSMLSKNLETSDQRVSDD